MKGKLGTLLFHLMKRIALIKLKIYTKKWLVPHMRRKLTYLVVNVRLLWTVGQ